MKKRILQLMTLVTLLFPMVANAKGLKPNDENEIRRMHTTAYCQGTITATGHEVRKGICAVDKEHMGENWLAMVWTVDENGNADEFQGYFECLDTGFGADSDGDGIGSIQEGKCIDVYFPTLEECKEWMKLTNGKCLVKYIWAVG